MKLKKKGKTLKIDLESSCTIIDVEAHADLLRSLPAGIDRIHLRIDDVTELDTAYLQCLYALKKEAEIRNIELNTTGKSKALDHACKLYGLEKIFPFSNQKKSKGKRR